MEVTYKKHDTVNCYFSEIFGDSIQVSNKQVTQIYFSTVKNTYNSDGKSPQSSFVSCKVKLILKILQYAQCKCVSQTIVPGVNYLDLGYYLSSLTFK